MKEHNVLSSSKGYVARVVQFALPLAERTSGSQLCSPIGGVDCCWLNQTAELQYGTVNRNRIRDSHFLLFDP